MPWAMRQNLFGVCQEAGVNIVQVSAAIVDLHGEIPHALCSRYTRLNVVL